MKKTEQYFGAGEYVDDAVRDANFTPRGLESATMSMSDIPEDADPEEVFNAISTQVEAARVSVTALDTAQRSEINGNVVFSVPAIVRGYKARRG